MDSEIKLDSLKTKIVTEFPFCTVAASLLMLWRCKCLFSFIGCELWCLTKFTEKQDMGTGLKFKKYQVWFVGLNFEFNYNTY